MSIPTATPSSESPVPASEAEIDELRKEIDRLDAEIRAAVKRRALASGAATRSGSRAMTSRAAKAAAESHRELIPLC